MSDEEKLSAVLDRLTAFIDQRIQAALTEQWATITREIVGMATIFAELKQDLAEMDVNLERLQLLLADRAALLDPPNFRNEQRH
jgi:hypothetical protein